jgi:hypothetical protein
VNSLVAVRSLSTGNRPMTLRTPRTNGSIPRRHSHPPAESASMVPVVGAAGHSRETLVGGLNRCRRPRFRHLVGRRQARNAGRPALVPNVRTAARWLSGGAGADVLGSAAQFPATPAPRSLYVHERERWPGRTAALPRPAARRRRIPEQRSHNHCQVGVAVLPRWPPLSLPVIIANERALG